MIKKALVSVWISVLAGMFLFAVSAAFGAELPSDVPPAGLVSPTFSGIYTSTINGQLDDNGLREPVYLQSDTSLLLNLPDGFSKGTYMEFSSGGISFGLKQEGSISLDASPGYFVINAASTALQSGDLIVEDGKLTVGTIDAPADHSNITFNSPVKFTETATFDVIPSFPASDIMTFYNVNVMTEINNPSEGIYGVKISDPDGLRVMGPVKIDGAISNYGGDIVDVSDNLKVTGKITAPTIGAYSTISGTIVEVAPGGSGYAEATCAPSSGYDVLIDCGMETYYLSESSYYVSNNAFVIRKIYPNYNSKTCKVRVKNEYTDTRYVQAVARCFGPNN